MSGRPDFADIHFDPRLEPPEPEDWNPRPGAEAERNYYDACEERDRGMIDHDPECPVCTSPYPNHQRGCWMGGDHGPTYRLTPASFNDNPFD